MALLMADPVSNKVLRFPDPPGAAPDRLDSWKEIAAYLRRGARTVQRWEAEQGLPVHRLQHEEGSTVYAYKQELDAWWTSRRPAPEPEPPPAPESAPSVAVLPFADMSQAQDQGYFCDGVAEEVMSTLARIPGLRVASRTSSFQFKGAAADSREIGRRLGVLTLLEGSVRRAGDRLRVAVHLTDCASGFQLWDGHYEREMRDIFAVQDEIAGQVAEALRVTLRGAIRRPSTADLAAYDYYLRGRQFFYHYNRRDVEFAAQLFSKATGLDPAYASAHAGLADCWSYLYLYANRSKPVLLSADTASRQAVELDPESASAHASRGLALSLMGQDEEARREFERALDLDPGLFEAHYFYARHSFARGELEAAIAHYEDAMRAHPEDYQAPLLAAQSYEVLGRAAEAREARERGIRLAEAQVAANPADSRAVYMAANGMVALGDFERGREWARRALAMGPDEPMVLYNVGCIFAMLGIKEDALACLEQAVERGLTQRGWFEHDSNLDSLRGEARFQTLLACLR
jgi:adenylate cyclase